MKKLFLSMLLIMLAHINYGQQNFGTIKGTVIDKPSQTTLPFVRLLLKDSTNYVCAHAVSDFNGKYIFNGVETGYYFLDVQFVGYDALTIPIEVFSDSIITLKHELIPAEDLNCIEVISCRQPISMVACKVSRNAISKRGRSHTAQSTESYAKFDDNVFKNVNKHPLSTLSIDVDNASYSNIRRFINNGELPPIDAVRIEEMINYFSYDYPQPKNNTPFAVDMEYTECPWNKKHQVARIGIQAKKIDFENTPANNLVFLIDVSGSMDTPNKLELLKKGLNLLVNQLREKDRVAIVVYAGAAGIVLPSTKGINKSDIKNAISKLKAGGSTAGGEGLKLAYDIAKKNFMITGNNRIILATDGDFNVGISGNGELERLIESKRNDHIFLSVLGFGMGNYKDDKMEILADKGNGNYYYIDNEMEAKKVLVKELGATLNVIAKDVKIQVEFNPKFVKSYKLIGYVNRKMNDEDFKNDKKDAGDLGAGHSVTVLYEIIPTNNKQVETTNYKYQNGLTINNSKETQLELLTVKYRFKTPKGKKSKLLTRVLNANLIPFDQTSSHTKFALAVTEFGMLLRQVKNKEITYQSILKLAKESKGEDLEGYRAEFIKLVEKASKIDV